MLKRFLFSFILFSFIVLSLNAKDIKATKKMLKTDIISYANELIINPMNIYIIKSLVKNMKKNDVTFYQNKDIANIFINSISFIDKNIIAQNLKKVFLGFSPFNKEKLKELIRQERLGKIIVSDEISKAKNELLNTLTKPNTYQSVTILMSLGKDYSKKLKKIETTSTLYNPSSDREKFYKTIFYLKQNDWNEVKRMAKNAKITHQTYMSHKKEIKIDITKIDSRYQIKDKYLKELIKFNKKNILHSIPYKVYYILLSSAILNNNWYKSYSKRYYNIYLYFRYLVLLHQFKINQSIDYLQLLINNYPYPKNRGIAYLYIDTILYAIKNNNDKEMDYIYAKTLWKFINKDLKLNKTSSQYNKILNIYKKATKDYIALLSKNNEISKIKKVVIELKEDLKILIEDNSKNK